MNKLSRCCSIQDPERVEWKNLKTPHMYFATHHIHVQKGVREKICIGEGGSKIFQFFPLSISNGVALIILIVYFVIFLQRCFHYQNDGLTCTPSHHDVPP